MRIALIRGPYINKFELQNYEPLAKKYQVKVFYPNNNFFDVKEINLPKEKVLTYESIFGKKISDYLRIPMHYPFGFYHGIPGLVSKLKDFQIAHGAETFYLNSLQIIKAKEKYKTKAVFTVWENIPFAHENFILTPKIKKIVNEKADLFLAITERAKLALILEGVDEKKIKVLPMGIDLKKFQKKAKNLEILKKLNLKKEDKIILFVGRLTYEKGIQDLVYAFSLLIKDKDVRENYRLLIVGDGPLFKKIKNLIKKLKIEKFIRFTSFPYQKMPGVYNLSEIFVLPSIPTKGWQEQFGMSFLEAMASELPVVSTLSGSIPEVIGDSGILVEPNDSLSLFKALKKLIENENLRKDLIEKGKKRVFKYFDSQKIAPKLESLYLELLKKRF